MQKFLKQFLALESSSGILLFLAAALSMLWANSPLADFYIKFTDTFLRFINEGLMAIFFLLVGLELKRNYVTGALSNRSIILPLVAAVGGMLVPAMIYFGINAGNPITTKGWAIPVATDIAFAIGVLSLFGRRLPQELRLFLLSLAIFDDLGAIIIIELFFSHGLSYFLIFQACILTIVLYLLNRYAMRSLAPYLFVGGLLWVTLFHSGVHPTVAGVLLALAIPHHALNRLESFLHPWVAYFIMPIFALANAGFSLAGMSVNSLFSVIVLGITLGLFIGKQLGVFGFAWLAIKLKFVKKPGNISWLSLYGVALLCGIGFTMSLFLGTLSFQGEVVYLSEVRLGVIIGSILSGLTGALVLLAVTKEMHR